MQKVKHHYKQFLTRLEQQFVYMLTIGALFSVIGWAVPNLYYHYLDKTDYYSVTQPVSTDKSVYKPCDEVILSTKRVSLTDLVIDASNSLIRVDEQDPSTIIRVYEAPDRPNVVVKESDGQPVAFLLKIPCDVSNGTYFWRGAVQYEVHEVKRTYVYTTDLFKVESEEQI